MKENIPIHIAIANNDTYFNETFARRICEDTCFAVPIVTTNGCELLEKIEMTTRLPDVCIIDIDLHYINGYKLVKMLKQKWPVIDIVVYTKITHPHSIHYMIKKGANAYLKQETSIDELIKILLAVKNGEVYFPGYSARQIQEILRDQRPSPLDIDDRHKEFLYWYFRGLTNERIAQKIYLSTRTIKAYKADLMQRFKVADREGLIDIVLNTFIISELDKEIPYKDTCKLHV